MSVVRVLLWLFLFFFQGLAYGQKIPEQSAVDENIAPIFHDQGALYADIDTAGHRLFVVADKNLWQYDLDSSRWQLLDSLQSISGELKDLEFGYNAGKGRIQFWSRGVGKMYYVNPQTGQVRRVDKSFNHHNQFYHFPFFYRGTLYAFGGYGFWEWHNILTFYNSELGEWNIQTTEPETPMPEERVPNTGYLNPDTQELYIYGGETTVNQHPDDQKITRKTLRDIWRFSFEEHRWEKVMELPAMGFSFYKPKMINKVGETNMGVSSLYFPDQSLWCLPVVPVDNPDNGFYLKPVNVNTHQIYSEQMVDLGNSNRLIPTHFLYDPHSKEVIVIGFDNLSRSQTYPIKVVRIPEQEILSKLDASTLSVLNNWYTLFPLSILLVVLIWLYLRYQSDSETSETITLPFRRSDIAALQLFTDEEKTLLMYLFDERDFLESQQIEEYLWAGIENYDYRRKLRNDIIKSVNDKFRERQNTDAYLIIRRKDPDDKRRYLYGLNEQFVDRK